MHPERINDQFANQSEQLTPLEKFDRLLGLMKSLADKHAVIDKGWYEFPQKEVTISRGDDVETHTVQMYIFVPRPLAGYNNASYSPSITMQLGSLIPEETTGKLIGSAERKYVKKSFLEPGSAYYKDNHKPAAIDIESIDKMFLNYKITLETSPPTG